MYIILSQKIDSASTYTDELFKTYHYPSRYKNQIHEGDIFVYYQGNRYNKEQRYYFGTGSVKKIYCTDNDNYYAVLDNCKRFDKVVPIYHPEGGYIEQLGYETVRKSKLPPWQSSIRPLSQEAFQYILASSGSMDYKEYAKAIDSLKTVLKESITAFFRDHHDEAIFDIERIAAELAKLINEQDRIVDWYGNFSDYCKTTKMTYSYKAVLILAFLSCADGYGRLHISDAVTFFECYYNNRLVQGKKAEKHNSVFLKPNLSASQIEKSVIDNPVNALCKSPFFSFDPHKKAMTMNEELWSVLGDKEKSRLNQICIKRLDDYYKS